MTDNIKLTDTDTHVYVSGCDLDGIARGKIVCKEKFLQIAGKDKFFGFWY
jgi:hypothetical protein